LQKNFPDKINWTKIKEIKTIGIDEIALKKGHKDLALFLLAWQININIIKWLRDNPPNL
jgi:hypothetical protein